MQGIGDYEAHMRRQKRAEYRERVSARKGARSQGVKDPETAPASKLAVQSNHTPGSVPE